ncbi:TBC1 domain family member 14 [Zalerion maritima]|uniref:TBC1 domain family member 14 n=1 Tax=Zalerion maritima TaxID=339359 RepID=A0AAD5RP58_9PEZI|nr:TBC1 domain family member 14 [Zalerion maritima]
MIYTDVDIAPSPGSPPGMTSSKTSKSSSFQSLHSDDGSVLADVGHFEDIGLDGDEPVIYQAQQIAIHSQEKLKIVPQPKTRELAVGGNRPRPGLAIPKTRPPLSLQTDSRPRNLPVAVSSSSRSRSPGPNPYVVGALKPRRSSWQSFRDRRSSLELERDYDEDMDDDIPDDLILDNVPISPRPMHDREPSRDRDRAASSPVGSLGANVPSPRGSRSSASSLNPPKDRTKSAGAGTPPVPSSQNSGSLRTPTWKSDTAVPTAKSLPPSPLKVRAKSWNLALNAETKALTAKLEEHADEQLRLHPNDMVAANMNRRSLDSTSPTSSSHRSTGNKDPFKRQLLLQQTNMMIDPLPMSKEKEAVLSRTRPSWLPPKDPAEERKHLKEYERMMEHSRVMERRRELDRKNKTKAKDAMTDNRKQLWEQEVLPRWDIAIRERRTRDLWWKGVVPRCRGAVWARAIGNDLGLSETSFNAALKRSAEIEKKVAAGNGTSEEVRRAEQFKLIRLDVQGRTWPDLKIFQSGGPLNQAIVDVLCAYTMYRSDIGYVPGCNTIAALLLLNLTTSTEAFIALANILNRPLPLSFYASDPGAKASAYNLLSQILGLKSPSLHKHLMSMSSDPDVFLADVFSGLFTSHLALDEAARLWDVYVFEGDSVLVRAGVAILMLKEMDLLATSDIDEVKVLLKSGEKGIKGDRDEEKWMATLKEAGKA